MTTLTTIQGNFGETDSRNSTGILDRLVEWMNNVVDGVFGPAVGEAIHDNPAEAYLFLNSGCCGAIIDTELWDLLTERKSQPEDEEINNV